MFHEVLVFGIHPHNAAASALLAAIGADRQTLNISGMRNSDDNLFTRNQILIQDAFFSNRDFCTAVIRIPVTDLLELIADNLQYEMLISQNLTVLSNLGQQLIIFVLNFFTFQAGQTLHPHIKDGLCLLYAETECAHQAIPRNISRAGCADQSNNFIQMIQCDTQSFQNMRPCLSFFEIKNRPAPNNFNLMLQVMVQHIPEIKNLRFVINDGKHVDTKCGLHRGMLVKIIQHHARVHITSHFNDYTHTIAVRFIPKICNAFNPFLTH
ncbi:hypothetical protein D3C73_634510 [compost metagenome]